MKALIRKTNERFFLIIKTNHLIYFQQSALKSVKTQANNRPSYMYIKGTHDFNLIGVFKSNESHVLKINQYYKRD